MVEALEKLMEDTVHVKGLSQLQRFLDTLPVKVERNIMRGAMRAGAKVVLPVAKAKIRNRSGETAASLRISTRARGSKVTARIVAGNSKNPNVPIWLEYGTRAHLISVQDSEKPINRRASARAGRVIRASMTTINRNVLRIGNRFVGPTVSHPGARRFPFMRPALDAMASAAVTAIGEYIKKRLTKQGIDASAVIVEGDT